MSKQLLLSTPIVLLFFTTAPAAQSPQTAGPSTNTAPDSITLKGCVAESMGRYMLNQASIVKPIFPTPVPSAAAEPAREPRSDDQVYELVGPEVKTHVGHQIEVVGTMPPTPPTENAQVGRTADGAPDGGHGPTSRRVTMIASTCP